MRKRPPQELRTVGGIAPEAQPKSLCPHASLRLQDSLAKDLGSRHRQNGHGFVWRWRARVPLYIHLAKCP